MNQHLEMLYQHDIGIYNMEMGCCIPLVGIIVETAEKLDREKPYDNGFTLNDVRSVEILGNSEDSTKLRLRLWTNVDGRPYIITDITVGEENGTVAIVRE